MRIVSLNLKRNHYGTTAEDACQALNVGNGLSTALEMAVDPAHRPQVEEYRHIVGWKLGNTDGDALAKWRAVAAHLDVVLAASQPRHDWIARKQRAQVSERTR
jgi:hypothetical protein